MAAKGRSDRDGRGRGNPGRQPVHEETPRAGTGRLNLTLPDRALSQLQEIADADFLERTDVARIAILTWLRDNYPRYREGAK
jgi:hypothetical protein